MKKVYIFLKTIIICQMLNVPIQIKSQHQFITKTNNASINGCNAENISSNYNSTFTRHIYQFNCKKTIGSKSNLMNPPIPMYLESSELAEYNELDLSPNTYSQIPSESICLFTNIYLLDMSSNLLKYLDGFSNLKCLSNLKIIDFSNNLISTSLSPELFNEEFAANIQSLNLTSNRIKSISSKTFIKSDGSSRFPSLSYLGLAYNLIANFDLLWPLTLPSLNLFVDLKFNPIQNLVNDMNVTFRQTVFNNPMINNRHLDATTNMLQYMDDTNLLQYGITNENDFKIFLSLIANYDLRQSNLVRTFICYCPPKGLLTVFWYRNVFKSIQDKSTPIYNLYCSNYQNSVYIFDFPCAFSIPSNESNKFFHTLMVAQQTIPIEKAQIITSTTSIMPASTISSKKSTAINSFSSKAKTSVVRYSSTLSPFIPGTINNLVILTKKSLIPKSENIESKALDTSNDAQLNTNGSFDNANQSLYLLFLLFIPFFIFLILLFICCVGRCCQIHTNHMCDLLLCPCMRPDDEKSASIKFYDATICYSEYDEQWLDEQFVPQLSQFENNFKIHKLTLYHRSNDKISRENEKILRTSKRIILVFSKKFLEEEWSNKSFRNVLRDICLNDNLCVIICINVGEFKQKKIDTLLLDIETTLYDFLSNENEKTCSTKIKQNIKYNCGLNNLERLHIEDSNFWKKFNFLMPRIGYDNTKPAIITDSSRDKKIIKLPKLSVTNINSNGNTDSNISIDSDKKRFSVDSLHSSSSVTTNNKRERIKQDMHLSYASNYKNSKSLRHIIVPIPDFMRTQLGYGLKNAIEAKQNEIINQSSKTALQKTQSHVYYERNKYSNVSKESETVDEEHNTYIDEEIQLQQTVKKANALPPLLISHQNDKTTSSDLVKSNKISIINSNLNLLPNQENTLVKNYLPSENEVIKMNMNVKVCRSDTPEILALFKPKSSSTTKHQNDYNKERKKNNKKINLEQDDK